MKLDFVFVFLFIIPVIKTTETVDIETCHVNTDNENKYVSNNCDKNFKQVGKLKLISKVYFVT